jgi:hypothetical protein
MQSLSLGVETISTSAFLAWHKDKSSRVFIFNAGDLVVQHSIDEVDDPSTGYLMEWNGAFD